MQKRKEFMQKRKECYLFDVKMYYWLNIHQKTRQREQTYKQIITANIRCTTRDEDFEKINGKTFLNAFRCKSL